MSLNFEFLKGITDEDYISICGNAVYEDCSQAEDRLFKCPRQSLALIRQAGEKLAVLYYKKRVGDCGNRTFDDILKDPKFKTLIRAFRQPWGEKSISDGLRSIQMAGNNAIHKSSVHNEWTRACTNLESLYTIATRFLFDLQLISEYSDYKEPLPVMKQEEYPPAIQNEDVQKGSQGDGRSSAEFAPSYKVVISRDLRAKQINSLGLIANLEGVKAEAIPSDLTYTWGSIKDDGSLHQIPRKLQTFRTDPENGLGKVFQCEIRSSQYPGDVWSGTYGPVTDADFIPPLSGEVEISPTIGKARKGKKVPLSIILKANLSNINAEGKCKYVWLCGNTKISTSDSPKLAVKKEDISKAFVCKVTHPGREGEIESKPYVLCMDDYSRLAAELNAQNADDKSDAQDFHFLARRLYYCVGSRNDFFATNSLEYMDFNRFLKTFLKEMGYERIVIVDSVSRNADSSYPVITYDLFSQLSFLNPNQFDDFIKQHSEEKATAVQLFCKEYAANCRGNLAQPKLPRYGKRVICTIREASDKNTSESFESFLQKTVSPALASDVLKSAIVIPAELFRQMKSLNGSILRSLQNQLERSSDNVLIVTADRQEDLQGLFSSQCNGQASPDDFKKMIEKLVGSSRILTVASQPGRDEIANLLLINKMNRPKEFSQIPYRKVQPLAQYLSTRFTESSNSQEISGALLSDRRFTCLRDLESALLDKDMVNAFVEIVNSLPDRTIQPAIPVRPAYLGRIYVPDNKQTIVSLDISSRSDNGVEYASELPAKTDLDVSVSCGSTGIPKGSAKRKFSLIPRDAVTKWPDPYQKADVQRLDFPGECSHAILRIETEFGTATAFLITPDGYAVTCAHAIAEKGNLDNLAAQRLIASCRPDKTQRVQNFGFEIINTRPDLDMALIKVHSKSDFAYLKLSDESRLPRIGEKCNLYGYPEGHSGIMLVPGTICSMAERGMEWELGDIYYFYGNATPGDSGGPLISENDGCVIGILRGARRLKSKREKTADGEGKQYDYIKPLFYFWKEFLK